MKEVFRYSKFAETSTLTSIVKLTELAKEVKDLIAFTVGEPAPEIIPTEKIKEITDDILSKYGTKALQYGATCGDIIPTIVDFLKKYDTIEVEEDEVIILTGALQGGFLTCQTLLNPGDYILAETPFYSLHLQNFRMFQANIVSVKMDENGLIPEDLEKRLFELKKKGIKPKFLYTIPDFQNPTGRTLPLQRRKEIIEIAKKYELPIFEDTPYRYMRYKGKSLPSLFELAKDIVIHCNSFSKVLSTGLRVGYVLAQKDFIKKMKPIKQLCDYNTPRLNQYIIKEFIERGLWDEQIKRIKNVHYPRLLAMLEVLKKELPKHPEITYNEPEGGTYIWLTLPQDIDLDKFLEFAIKKGVAFIPSYDFYPPDCNIEIQKALRINFPYYPEERTKEGARRICSAIREFLNL